MLPKRVEISNLPDDPEEAFIVFYDRVMESCEEYKRENRSNNDGLYIPEKFAIGSLLSFIQMRNIPHAGDINFNDFYDTSDKDAAFVNCAADINRVITSLMLKHSNKAKYLSTEQKTEIADLLNKIRQIVDEKLDAGGKKDLILRKINNLQSEIDADKTQLETARKVCIDTTATIKTSWDNLPSPVTNLIKRLAEIFWNAEEKKLLESDEKPLITSKTQQNNENGNIDDTDDDDIPF